MSGPVPTPATPAPPAPPATPAPPAPPAPPPVSYGEEDQEQQTIWRLAYCVFHFNQIVQSLPLDNEAARLEKFYAELFGSGRIKSAQKLQDLRSRMGVQELETVESAASVARVIRRGLENGFVIDAGRGKNQGRTTALFEKLGQVRKGLVSDSGMKHSNAAAIKRMFESDQLWFESAIYILARDANDPTFLETPINAMISIRRDFRRQNVPVTFDMIFERFASRSDVAARAANHYLCAELAFSYALLSIIVVRGADDRRFRSAFRGVNEEDAFERYRSNMRRLDVALKKLRAIIQVANLSTASDLTVQTYTMSSMHYEKDPAYRSTWWGKMLEAGSAAGSAAGSGAKAAGSAAWSVAGSAAAMVREDSSSLATGAANLLRKVQNYIAQNGWFTGKAFLATRILELIIEIKKTLPMAFMFCIPVDNGEGEEQTMLPAWHIYAERDFDADRADGDYVYEDDTALRTHFTNSYRAAPADDKDDPERKERQAQCERDITKMGERFNFDDESVETIKKEACNKDSCVSRLYARLEAEGTRPEVRQSKLAKALLRYAADGEGSLNCKGNQTTESQLCKARFIRACRDSPSDCDSTSQTFKDDTTKFCDTSSYELGTRAVTSPDGITISPESRLEDKAFIRALNAQRMNANTTCMSKIKELGKYGNEAFVLFKMLAQAGDEKLTQLCTVGSATIMAQTRSLLEKSGDAHYVIKKLEEYVHNNEHDQWSKLQEMTEALQDTIFSKPPTYFSRDTADIHLNDYWPLLKQDIVTMAKNIMEPKDEGIANQPAYLPQKWLRAGYIMSTVEYEHLKLTFQTTMRDLGPIDVMKTIIQLIETQCVGMKERVETKSQRYYSGRMIQIGISYEDTIEREIMEWIKILCILQERLYPTSGSDFTRGIATFVEKVNEALESHARSYKTREEVTAALNGMSYQEYIINYQKYFREVGPKNWYKIVQDFLRTLSASKKLGTHLVAASTITRITPVASYLSNRQTYVAEQVKVVHDHLKWFEQRRINYEAISRKIDDSILLKMIVAAMYDVTAEDDFLRTFISNAENPSMPKNTPLELYMVAICVAHSALLPVQNAIYKAIRGADDHIDDDMVINTIVAYLVVYGGKTEAQTIRTQDYGVMTFETLTDMLTELSKIRTKFKSWGTSNTNTTKYNEALQVVKKNYRYLSDVSDKLNSLAESFDEIKNTGLFGASVPDAFKLTANQQHLMKNGLNDVVFEELRTILEKETLIKTHLGKIPSSSLREISLGFNDMEEHMHIVRVGTQDLQPLPEERANYLDAQNKLNNRGEDPIVFLSCCLASERFDVQKLVMLSKSNNSSREQMKKAQDQMKGLKQYASALRFVSEIRLPESNDSSTKSLVGRAIAASSSQFGPEADFFVNIGSCHPTLNIFVENDDSAKKYKDAEKLQVYCAAKYQFTRKQGMEYVTLGGLNKAKMNELVRELDLNDKFTVI